jgi:hypothetical protein
MIMKTILPWVLVLGLGIAVFALFSSNQKQAAELAQLHQQSEEAQKAQTVVDTKSQPPSEEELTQLHKDHEDVLRLRNEVRTLRDEKQQIARQAQAAQAAQTAAANAQQTEQMQKLAAENQQLKLQSAATQQRDQIVACMNNLRQIDGAKQQFALEAQKQPGSLISTDDLAPYFPNKVFPTCPAGGVYTLNPIGLNPICNIPGHVLAK